MSSWILLVHQRGGGTEHSPDLVAAQAIVVGPGAGRGQVLPTFLQFSSLLVAGLSQGRLFISALSSHAWNLGCFGGATLCLCKINSLLIMLNLALGLKDFS